MTSVDSNVLLYAYSEASPYHGAARRFLIESTPDPDIAISEFVLVEFYTLLRNPVVLERPLDPPAAVEAVNAYRRHPTWMLLGFDSDSVGLHGELWKRAAEIPFARRRIYDTRLALSLRRQGVTRFATANTAHFQEFGFDRVWNPLDT